MKQKKKVGKRLKGTKEIPKTSLNPKKRLVLYLNKVIGGNLCIKENIQEITPPEKKQKRFDKLFNPL